MATGYKTTDLPETALADEFLVNRGGSTARMKFDAIGTQLAASGPIAEGIAQQSARIDQIEIDGGVYETVLSGITHTLPGAQFRVASSDPEVSYRIYRHDPGQVATLVLEAPSVTALSSRAPLDSPDLTGIPKAPTPAPGTNSTQIANTEFVMGLVGTSLENIADRTETVEGHDVIVDDAGQALMRAGSSGLDFIPSDATAARVLSKVAVAETMTGHVLIEDDAGNVLLSADKTGLRFIPAADTRLALNAPISDLPPDAILPRRIDDTRRGFFRVTETGALVEYHEPPFDVTRVNLSDPPLPFWMRPGPLELILATGQSLLGGAGASLSDIAAPEPPLSRAALAYNLSGQTGYWHPTAPYGGSPASGEITGFVTVEWNRPWPDGEGATPMLVIGDSLPGYRAAIGAPLGQTPLVMTVHAPGTDIDRLDNDPTTGGGDTNILNWSNLEYFMPRAVAHAAATGYTISTKWHLFDHGTADRFALDGEYYPKLLEYLADIDALYVSHGLKPPRHIITQAGGYPYSGEAGYNHPWGVKVDQLRAAQEGRVILACPQYVLQTGTDKVHPLFTQVFVWAETVARCIAELEAGRAWPSLAPRLVSKTATQIVLEFDTRPDEALAFNAQKYTAGCEDYGFDCVGAPITMTPPGFSSSGTVRQPIAISNVSITARNQVTITVADTAQVTQVKYAMQTQDMSSNTDPYTSHRGLLRTTYGWQSRYYPDQTLYRWVPGFRISV